MPTSNATHQKLVIHRRHVISASIMGVISGLIYLLVPTTKYQYSTDIFLGEAVIGDTIQPLEPFVTSMRIVMDSILSSPNWEPRAGAVVDLEKNVLVVEVENGREIRLRTDGPVAYLEDIQAMHRFVADRVLTHLKGREEFRRSRAQGRLKAAQNAYESAKSFIELNSADISQAAIEESKLVEAIQDLSNSIAEDDKRGPNAPASEGLPKVGDGTLALGKRGLLAMYQRLRLSSLPVRRVDNAAQRTEAARVAIEAELRISDLSVEIATIDPPRISRFVQRSVDPVGAGKTVRLIAGFVIGIIIYFAGLAAIRLARNRLTIA